ncbi:MAG TPA: response regulator [Coleofasciculaceae cyanobacterium]|jgi:CheY-like chemotaxis protein
MYKIAVVDDDKSWCYAVQRFFRKDFEVFTFTKVCYFLPHSKEYDLVLVDYSIPPAIYEDEIEGCELIQYLKNTLVNPPILVLSSAFIGKTDLELGKKICPEADAFFAKDAGLEELLQETKQLLASRSLRLRDTKEEPTN